MGAQDPESPALNNTAAKNIPMLLCGDSEETKQERRHQNHVARGTVLACYASQGCLHPLYPHGGASLKRITPKGHETVPTSLSLMIELLTVLKTLLVEGDYILMLQISM